ncbi:ankyrin repeat domain-containing protein [Amylibacter sp. SFDW26]|uniref:ankyrin repeat domain-containing protein n=1 Tax=Amylibacter sp. SFDW26 TaxID=2652722 RepID=UPI0012624581|nr:ankyrin repeat domain-containing protein [Amylibacter sp. SFDW26]KAB7615547.1 ankyrin repeat domain-containing protein [Amylibacter sp. SFDW26]
MRGQMGRLIEFMHDRMKPQSSTEALHIAAFEGDLTRIEFLVNVKKNDVNTELSTIMGASHRQTPLFLAIQEGNIMAAKLLIELGAKIDLVNDIGITPLMSAASHGDIQSLKLLLSLGASPNFYRHSDGASALSFCMHADVNDNSKAEITDVLIEAGADVELPQDKSQSVLMLAAREDLPKVVKTLLDAGANPERKCTLKWAMDWTALDHAINEGSKGAREILEPITEALPIARTGCVH